MKKSKLITMAISLLAAICLWIYVVTVVNPGGDDHDLQHSGHVLWG